MGHRYVPVAALLGLVLLWAAPAAAQQSSQHRIEESAFNSGGHPIDGLTPQSTSHEISLGALGDSVLAPVPLIGANSTIDGGFVSTYRPPSEVANLRFDDVTTLGWDPDPAVGDYALYVGTILDPFDTDYGACELPTLPTATAQAPTVGAPGTTLFYLVTSRNRLREESTKGPGRANPAPCP